VCTASDTFCNTTIRCVACGLGGQPCCDGKHCLSGACCDESTGTYLCVAPGNACGGALGVCRNGSCGGCGALTEPCCGAGFCTESNTVCSTGNTGCEQCGGIGERCCPPDNYCSGGHICNTLTGLCQ
jgi:hypothetical protein